DLPGRCAQTWGRQRYGKSWRSSDFLAARLPLQRWQTVLVSGRGAQQAATSESQHPQLNVSMGFLFGQRQKRGESARLDFPLCEPSTLNHIGNLYCPTCVVGNCGFYVAAAVHFPPVYFCYDIARLDTTLRCWRPYPH